MPPLLLLSSTVDRALDHLIDAVQAAQRPNPLAPVHILVPTVNVAHVVLRRLGNRLGVHLDQFYALGKAILDIAGSPIYEVSDATVRQLVFYLLGEMLAEGELSTFVGVWDKPGFTAVLIDWLREMKSQGIWPEDLLGEAERTGNPRDHQLGQLYNRYQTFLQQNELSDADGLLWLAAEALERDPHLLHPGPLFVFGFDQFNPVQLRILAQLARRKDPCTIYLAWDPQRPATSLALSRLARTRQDLQETLKPVEQIPEEPPQPPSALVHLRQTLFESALPAREASRQDQVRLVTAPSREAEVRWVLREVKGLLQDGITPAEIAILVPEPGIYAPLMRAAGHEYNVPILVDTSLNQNPALAAFFNILGLAPEFPWRQVFDALRSPYIQQSWLTDKQIGLLDQLTRERPVVGGRDQWSFALTPVTLEADDEADDELGPAPLASTLPAEELAAIHQGLMAFFDHVTPSSPDTPRGYILWLQEAILGLFSEDNLEAVDADQLPPTLNLVAACQDNAFAARDLAAMAKLSRLLRQLVEAADAVPSGDGGLLSWEAYRDYLLDALPPAPLPAALGGTWLRFGPLAAGRSLPVDHLFVLGLSEGEFPQPPAPDPLYAPAEREAHSLPLLRTIAGDDACLWWQVVASCRQRLTLLRPRLDENGAPWEPSPYWDAVSEKLEGLEPLALPMLPPAEPNQAASPNELLVALAQQGAKAVPPELAEAWQAAQDAFEVLQVRQGWREPGVFEGLLMASDILDQLAQRFGPERSWSASRLNRYGRCPYGFFAEAVLKLEARPDPQEGLDPRQRGSLLHQLLEDLHRQLAAEGLALTPANREKVLVRLEGVCQKLFPTAPVRYGFRPNALWRYEQEELRRQLQALIDWECQENGPDGRFLSWQQELRFGLSGSPWPSLKVRDQAGTQFRLHGIVDRLDRDDAGQVRVIDYKSGSAPFYQGDIQEGLALQTALYALAVEDLSPDYQVIESAFLHIPTRKLSGRLDFAGPVIDNETVQQAIESAARFVRRARDGIFPSLPGKPQRGGTACAQTCDLAGVCRVTRHAIAKARRMELP